MMLKRSVKHPDLDINSMQGKKNRPLLMENMNLMK